MPSDIPVSFPLSPFENLVSTAPVSALTTCVWIRAAHPGNLLIEWWPVHAPENRRQQEVVLSAANASDNTVSVLLERLSPGRSYTYSVTHQRDNSTVGKGTFKTPPLPAEKLTSSFSFALLSCNQPISSDGTIHPEAQSMMRAAVACLDKHKVSMVFMMGDQVYVDAPGSLSLFNDAYFASVAPEGKRTILECTAQEIRALYQARYRATWNTPEWKRILSTYPCYMMWDDHEIVNNWGIKEEHQTDIWAAIGNGARKAFIDYQRSRISASPEMLPESLHYRLDYGPAAFFVMDLRSKRTVRGRTKTVGEQQWKDLDQFLHTRSGSPLLFIVMSVPAVHLPQGLPYWLSRIPGAPGDFVDRWSSHHFTNDKDRLLKRLHDHQLAHPEQSIVLLSGDIHTGCAQHVIWESGASFYQFISSPITHGMSDYIKRISRWLIRSNKTLRANGMHATVNLLPDAQGGDRTNPFSGLNIGIVEALPHGNTIAIRYLLYSHKNGNPECVYASPRLPNIT